MGDDMYDGSSSLLGGIFGGDEGDCSKILCWVLVILVVIIIVWIIGYALMKWKNNSDSFASNSRCSRGRPSLMRMRTLELPPAPCDNSCAAGSACAQAAGCCCDDSSVMGASSMKATNVACDEGFTAPGYSGVSANQSCECIAPRRKPCSNLAYGINELTNLADYTR